MVAGVVRLAGSLAVVCPSAVLAPLRGAPLVAAAAGAAPDEVRCASHPVQRRANLYLSGSGFRPSGFDLQHSPNLRIRVDPAKPSGGHLHLSTTTVPAAQRPLPTLVG